jgi:hypothetical protein
MKPSWMTAVSGTLQIVSGVVGMAVATRLAIAIALADDFLEFAGVGYWIPVDVVAVLWVAVLWIITVPLALCALVALVGGVVTLWGRQWGLALAGSIASVFTLLPLGIAATVLTALARNRAQAGTPIQA